MERVNGTSSDALGYSHLKACHNNLALINDGGPTLEI